MKLSSKVSMDTIAALIERGARTRMQGELAEAEAKAKGFESARKKASLDRLTLVEDGRALTERANGPQNFGEKMLALLSTTETERAQRALAHNHIELERTERRRGRASDGLAAAQQDAKDILDGFAMHRTRQGELRDELAATRQAWSFE